MTKTCYCCCAAQRRGQGKSGCHFHGTVLLKDLVYGNTALKSFLLPLYSRSQGKLSLFVNVYMYASANHKNSANVNKSL